MKKIIITFALVLFLSLSVQCIGACPAYCEDRISSKLKAKIKKARKGKKKPRRIVVEGEKPIKPSKTLFPGNLTVPWERPTIKFDKLSKQ